MVHKNLPDSPPGTEAREGHPRPHSLLTPDRSRGQKLIHTGFNVPLLNRVVIINRYTFCLQNPRNISYSFLRNKRKGKERKDYFLIYILLNCIIIDVN